MGELVSRIGDSSQPERLLFTFGCKFLSPDPPCPLALLLQCRSSGGKTWNMHLAELSCSGEVLTFCFEVVE